MSQVAEQALRTSAPTGGHPASEPAGSSATVPHLSSPAINSTAAPDPTRARAWWGDRGIKVKILAAVAVPTIAASVIGITGMQAMHTATGYTESIYSDNLAGVEQVGQLESQIEKMRIASLGAALTDSADDTEQRLSEFKDEYKSIHETLIEYENTGITAEQRSVVTDLATNIESYTALVNETLAPLAVDRKPAEWVAQNDAQGIPIVKEMTTQLASLRQMEHADAEAKMAQVASSESSQTVAAIVIILAGVLLAMMVGLVVASGIARATRKVLSLAHALAEGDLTRRTGLTTADEIGQMGHALDVAVADLRTVMSTVVGDADAVAASSEELSVTSTQISAAAEETSAQAGVVSASSEQVSQNVQTVASATEQMSASIQEIASNAATASDVSSQAVAAAASTSATMAKLGKSSEEIGSVVKIITSIADQTNLLALNATIEAARAGDSGKGFAVVANEVKELAQETASATSDIGALVAGIQQDTATAVAAIEQISHIVEQISERQTAIASAVEQQTTTTQEITRSVNEAAIGTSEIARNIVGVSTAAESTTEALGQSSAAIAELSSMAADLRATVSRFTY